MIYLFDTHYILWSLFKPHKIPAQVRAILEDDARTVMASPINLWEISLKYSIGKLNLGEATPELVHNTILKAGFELAKLDNDLLASYYKLSQKDDHKDPFDRMLIWQAITNDYTLITQDQKFDQYAPDGLKLFRP